MCLILQCVYVFVCFYMCFIALLLFFVIFMFLRLLCFICFYLAEGEMEAAGTDAIGVAKTAAPTKVIYAPKSGEFATPFHRGLASEGYPAYGFTNSGTSHPGWPQKRANRKFPVQQENPGKKQEITKTYAVPSYNELMR